MEPDWLYYYDSTAQGGAYGGNRGFTRIECVGRYESPAGKFPSPKAPNGWLRGHIASMYAFLNAVYNQTEVCPSFSDGAAVQRVLDAALVSFTEGKEIRID